MRKVLSAAAIGLAAVLVLPALAQEWKPTRAVEIIAPATPGGGFDTDARRLQKILQENKFLDVPITVVNRPGGGGAIGWNSLNSGSNDGHTVAVSTTTLLTTDIVGTSGLRYTDFTPIAVMANGYLVLAVQEKSEFKSPQDLISAIKKNPKSVTFAASPGPGNANHILIAMIARSIGVDVADIPIVYFPSAADVAVALLGGHVKVAVGTIPPFMQHKEANTLRFLAVGAPQRLPGKLSDVPTLREAGADAVFLNWRGVIGPKDMKSEQVTYWEGILKQVSETAEWQKENERAYNVVDFTTGQAARDMLAAQYDEVKSIMRELGLAK